MTSKMTPSKYYFSFFDFDLEKLLDTSVVSNILVEIPFFRQIFVEYVERLDDFV